MRVKILALLGCFLFYASAWAEPDISAEKTPPTHASRYFQSAFQKTRKTMRMLSLEKLREMYFFENKNSVLKKRLKVYQKSILPSLKSGIANHETISLPDASASELLNIAEYLSFVLLCETKFFYLNSDHERTLSDILLVQDFVDAFSGIPVGSGISAKYQVHYALNCLILRMIYNASNPKELEEMIVSLDKSKKTIEFKNLILSEKGSIDQNIGNIIGTYIKKSPESRKFKEKALKDLRSESFLAELKNVLDGIFLRTENISFVSVAYSQKKKALKTLKNSVALESRKLVQSSFAAPVYQQKYAPIVESALQSIVGRLTNYYEFSLMDITLNDLLTLSYLIKLHKLEHKSYPDKLSELTRSGFRIPRDRFSEKTYHYKKLSKKGFRLWSVGPDEKDDQAGQYFSAASGEGDVFLKPLN
jgi:hypothetical protein